MLFILILSFVSAVAMAALYVPGTDPSRIYYGTDTRAFAILIGAALAAGWPSWKRSEGSQLQAEGCLISRAESRWSSSSC